MHDPEYGLRRIYLPRTPMNKVGAAKNPGPTAVSIKFDPDAIMEG
jgi:hypothetical protein